MPRRNRVDPWGDLHGTAARGLFTGNRGCLVDDDGLVVRHHRSRLWITCRLEFRGWRHPLAAPRRWTPLFFLDDAIALAAGHRPCALCRREDYRAYRDTVDPSLKAVDLDRRLGAERLRRGRGVERAGDRPTWAADVADLPDGSVFVDVDGDARIVVGAVTMAFTFAGWTDPRPHRGTVAVLTPPTSVRALRNGFVPTLHLSARLAA